MYLLIGSIHFWKWTVKKIIETKDYDDLSTSFMEFLEDVAPQYRENVLKAYEYIEKELEVE